MLINDIQKKNVKEAIVNELIKAGIEPTVKEINNRTNDYFLNYNLGKPRYEIYNLEAHSQSNIYDWNKSIDEIQIDSNTMFEAITTLRNNIFTREDLINTSIKKAQDDVRKLNLRIESFKKVLANNEVYSFKTHIFKDYSNSEFYGNESINLPYTNSFIDLLHKRVISEKITLTDGILDLSNSSIEIESIKTSNYFNVIGNKRNVISVLNNSSILIKQSCKEIEENGVMIKITLKEPTDISTIALNVKSLNNIIGSVYLTNNDGYTEKIYTQVFIDSVEWNFPVKKLLSFEIILKKEVADEFNSLNNFNYILNNISVFNDIYETNSVYVSKPIEFNEIMDQVKIKTEDVILDETSIQYYAGIDNGIDIIDWIPLKKDTDVSLNLLNKKDDSFMQPIECKENTCIIGSLKNFYNNNSIKILSGYQQWNVEILENELFDEEYLININDYNKSNVICESVMDCDSYNISIVNNKLVVLTTTVYCDSRAYVEDKYIASINENPIQTKIFVNNDELMKNTNGKYNVSLKKGKNKIIILLYSNLPKIEKINFNFNLKDISQNIGCGGKMNLISLDAIKNQTMNDSKNVFAIDNANNIIVKFQKARSNDYFFNNILEDNINYQNNIRYFVSYKYLDNSKYKKCIVNNVPKIRIRLMAILNSSNNSISAQIKSYSFMVK